MWGGGRIGPGSSSGWAITCGAAFNLRVDPLRRMTNKRVTGVGVKSMTNDKLIHEGFRRPL